MEYIKSPFKTFVKTDTGKIVRTTFITETKIVKGQLYIVWEEIWYDTIATFEERVVATADTKEELISGKKRKK